MSAQALILSDEHGMEDEDMKAALRAMRCRGVRRDNVEKNVGERTYAFNALQRKALPRLYRPPDGTGGGLFT